MKIAINSCFGGFSLSDAAVLRYAEIKGIALYQDKDQFGNTAFWTVPKELREDQRSFYNWPMEKRAASNRKAHGQLFSTCPDSRSDPDLIQTIEELGDKANGRFSEITIVEVPDGVAWELDYYYGKERVSEAHRTWG